MSGGSSRVRRMRDGRAPPSLSVASLSFAWRIVASLTDGSSASSGLARVKFFSMNTTSDVVVLLNAAHLTVSPSSSSTNMNMST